MVSCMVSVEESDRHTSGIVGRSGNHCSTATDHPEQTLSPERSPFMILRNAATAECSLEDELC